jgi:hypothetical protein
MPAVEIPASIARLLPAARRLAAEGVGEIMRLRRGYKAKPRLPNVIDPTAS